MPFSRSIMPGPRPDAEALSSDMAGIGMNFATQPNPDANIENTLIYASEIGMEQSDNRVLSILTTWFEIHHPYVNADRLVRVVLAHPSERVFAYWAACATWLKKDRRFARLSTGYHGSTVDILPVGTQFQITRLGEDIRFKGTVLRVPQKTLRNRQSDVLSPEVLIRLHLGYYNRVRMGPSWRADVWTILQREPDAKIAEVARQAYSSFATAWQVAKDFNLIKYAEVLDTANSSTNCTPIAK